MTSRETALPELERKQNSTVTLPEAAWYIMAALITEHHSTLSVITFTHYVLLDRGLVKLTLLLRTGHVNYILDEYSLISSV